ncbi:glycosyltransferase family 2 protein [Tenacibaculum ascidiaceicola]|uniref:glycosyltransferase family 2 protein n=1 Tax=Tenacibaculum ascidiaceicola TaxID=1699411 RepID=UPI0038942BCA
MSQPKISVIVPVYNTPDYLEKCFDSILNQSLKEIELIIVNDASPNILDHEICEKYKHKDTRVKYIKHVKNKRQGGARNTALNEASGEYIAYVDSDDFLDENMYEVMYKKITEEGVDVLQCNTKYIDKDYNLKRTLVSSDVDIILDGKINIIKEFYKGKRINAAPTNKLFNRKFLLDNKVNFPENIFHEDYYFQLKCLVKVDKYIILKDGFYNQYDREGSSSRVFNSFSIKSWFELIDLMYNEVKLDNSLKVYNEVFSSKHLLLIAYKACENNLIPNFKKAMLTSQFLKNHKKTTNYINILIFFKKTGMFPLINLLIIVRRRVRVLITKK